MSPAIATPEPTPAQRLAEDQVVVLKELVEIGMKMARNLPTEAEFTDGEKMALSFARLSKAIRLSLALQTQLLKEAATAAAPAGPARVRKNYSDWRVNDR